ncbi:MAG: phenylacetic acid degradation protein [Bacteroidota bacterium]
MDDSHDPRIRRADVPSAEEYTVKETLDQWGTFEVFHQKSRGDHHSHVGCVHAPNPEIALLFAKEQYARRMKCVNLWVVRTADITASSYEDAEMFEPATDKSYREAFGYKNKHLIKKYKEEQAQAKKEG